MLIFGHTGITLGAATIVADVINRKPTWFAALSSYLDIRWLMVGSLLPDIIDKPVGQYIFRDTFNNGRLFSHTLLFLFIISALGFYLYKKMTQKWLLTLAAGTLAHLILDEMWQIPQTLFWPVLGFTFPVVADLEGWARNIWEILFSTPSLYITEAVGLAILLVFGAWLIKRKKLGAFLIHGKVS
jgi:inner membrane protein